MNKKPLIIITNDDGIDSLGIKAAAEAALPYGEILIVAPKHNSSGLGQSIPFNKELTVETIKLKIGDHFVDAYSMDTTPAQVVMYTLTHLIDRIPSLVISGINYGLNVGFGTAISGTIGAVLEAARYGIKGLAVSVEVESEDAFHMPDVDFRIAKHFTGLFCQIMLNKPIDKKVDVLKVDVPDIASEETPWRITRSSRQQYWVPVKMERNSHHKPIRLRFEKHFDLDTLEKDSDTYAVIVDRIVSVTPLSVDMTSNVDLLSLRKWLEEGRKTD